MASGGGHVVHQPRPRLDERAAQPAKASRAFPVRSSTSASIGPMRNRSQDIDRKVIDDAIAAWKPRHAAVAFRVMTCNAHSSGYYTSPKWLFDAGCKGFEHVRGGDDPTSGGTCDPAD